MRKLLIPILLLFMSCTSQTKHYDNYYFPVKNFFTEKTYYFVNQNDTTEKANWKMKTSISNKDTLFQTSIFDSKNRITEIMTEKVFNGNSKIDTYTLYDYDPQGNKLTADCKVIDSLVFKPDQKDGEQIQWKVSFKDYSSPSICELFKNRTLQAQNDNQKTFSDLMKFVVVATSQGYQYSMTSVYQKDKGLVSYKLILPDGKVKNFVLASIK